MAKFENGFGRLEFDENYLEYDVDIQAAAETMLGPIGKLGFNQFNKVIFKATGAPKRNTGKIRVEQIDNIRFSEMDKGYKLTNPVLNPSIGARISIVTASGGLNGTIHMHVEKDRVRDAKDFVDLLQSSILNRGRKVEIVDGLNVEETKVCPDCAETVKAAARKCRFCSFQFDSN